MIVSTAHKGKGILQSVIASNFVVCDVCGGGGLRVQEEHQDEDAAVRHGQSSRRAYFRELKKVLVVAVAVVVVVLRMFYFPMHIWTPTHTVEVHYRGGAVITLYFCAFSLLRPPAVCTEI